MVLKYPCSFSVNADRAPQLKASVRCLRFSQDEEMHLRVTKYPVAMIAVVLASAVVGLRRPPQASPQADVTAIVVDSADSTWERIHTKDEEFSILMPLHLPIFERGNQYLGANNVNVSSERVISGYQNGVVFIVKMYETANPAGLLSDYFDIFHYAKSFKRELSLPGFKAIQYLRNEAGLYHNIRCFAAKRRVYVVEVAGRGESNPAIGQFLSSLQLGDPIAKRNEVSASFLNDQSQTSVPKTSSVFSKSEVTHPALPLYLPIPVRPNGFRGTVTIKMVFSASGDVTDISIPKGLNSAVGDSLSNLARYIIFLPAEKDGHAVSQYSEVTFNFQ